MPKFILTCVAGTRATGRLRSAGPSSFQKRLNVVLAVAAEVQRYTSALRPETEIGRLRAFLIQTQEARREGFDASAVLNAKSFATSEYTQLFKNAEWRKRVTKKFDPQSTDLLILDRIELKPEYRGEAFGLLAIRCMIEMFGWACGLVACKPYPLQFERSNRWEPAAQVSRRADGLRKARKKLRRYWARVGFERVPGTMLYALIHEKALGQVWAAARRNEALLMRLVAQLNYWVTAAVNEVDDCVILDLRFQIPPRPEILSP